MNGPAQVRRRPRPSLSHATSDGTTKGVARKLHRVRHVEFVARHEDAERHAFNRRRALSTRCSRRSFPADPCAYPPTMGMTLIAGGLKVCVRMPVWRRSKRTATHTRRCARGLSSTAMVHCCSSSAPSVVLCATPPLRNARAPRAPTSSRGLRRQRPARNDQRGRADGESVPRPAGRHLGGSVQQAARTPFTVRGTEPAR